MNRPTFAVLLAAFIAIGTITVTGQTPDKPRLGFLSALKAGQSVAVKEVAGRFEIVIDDSLTELSHKIIEVGPDLVAVEDIGGLIETRIPVYSINSIVRLKVPQK